MNRFIEASIVTENKRVAENIFLLKLKSPQIASQAKPGQFCEIKVSENSTPLLRRPFSIAYVQDDEISFLIDIVGKGTELLSQKQKGDIVNVIGPLGKSFFFEDDFDIAFIVAGGIGFAPFPFLIKEIENHNKEIFRVAGFSTKSKIPSLVDENFLIATDDGSAGFNGNVVELLENIFRNNFYGKIIAFACGPLPMLHATKEFFAKRNIPLQISVETVMACGIGLCQGCPIEKADKSGYYLACKDGPVFNADEVIV